MNDTLAQKNVLVFSTPTCPYCTMVKQYLQQKGVPFKDIDVSRDVAAAREMVRRTGQMGVPVVDIGGQLVVGFDRTRINRLLNLN